MVRLFARGIAAAACSIVLGCFDGEEATAGLPCRNDGDCAGGLSCELGVCGGPTAAGTESESAPASPRLLSAPTR